MAEQTLAPSRLSRCGFLVGMAGLGLPGCVGAPRAANVPQIEAAPPPMPHKRRWPRWTPPDEMVARQPELEPYSIANGGMDPGLTNPLSVRALYIFQDGEDTLYRIHGTHQAFSIGRALSSGCVRMLNQDVADLHDRVPDGTTIVVRQPASMPTIA